MSRVPASEATRKRLKQMIEGTSTSEQLDRSALVKQAVRLVIEEALEAEVAQTLGREYYDRANPERVDRSAGAHRNGYRTGKINSAEGCIEYAVPQVRGLEGWRSEVRAPPWVARPRS